MPNLETVRRSNTPLYHICIGDPERDHLKVLEKAATLGTREFDWWNINKWARPGDMAIFYMTKPSSAFVAFGTVGRRADDVSASDRSQWYGRHCFWINDAKMLPRFVTLDETKAEFPAWSYLKHPVVTTIPGERAPSDLVERFLHFLQVPPLTQGGSDLAEPPSRIATRIYRILRDTDLARGIKSRHDYKCQICGHRIALPDGRFYAEAHHIKPLGVHKGLDVAGNILCLCPNHHAELDLGVRSIEISELRCVSGHEIQRRYVDYHNTKIHKSRLL